MEDDHYDRGYAAFGSVLVTLVGLGMLLGGLALTVALIRQGDWADVWVTALFMVPGVLMVGGQALRLRELRSTRPVPPLLQHVNLVMPLSTGASAVHLFAGPMIAGHLVTFGPLLVARWLPDWTVYPVGVAGALWMFVAASLLLHAWIRRPSDLRLAHDAMQIHGGPMHRTRHDWRDLPSPPATWQPHADDPTAGTLRIAGEVVAISEHPDEHASLQAVARTVSYLTRQARGQTLPDASPAPTEVLTCHACGAPVAPTAAATTICHRCDAVVSVPGAVREQVRASVELDAARSRSEGLFRRLLAQPGARTTSALLVLAIPPLLLGFPLTAILFDELHQSRGVLSWSDGVASFAAATSASYALGWLLSGQIAARRAIQLFATTFAARPPERDGEPWRCRQCGAPLPDKTGTLVVVGCVHCDADSITGIDLVPAAKVERAQVRSLRAELRHQIRARRARRASAVASFAVFAVSLAVLWPTLAKLWAAS